MTLRVYGPRAKFAAEQLVPVARTNDADVSSVATWVLGGIDPEAAKQAGVK
jgi:hypothetical protein